MPRNNNIIIDYKRPTSTLYLKWFDAMSRTLFTPRGSVLEPFVDQFGFAKQDNWDGQGALPLAIATLALAESLIVRFGGVDNLIEIAPGRDGSISFTWDDGRGNYIYLDVGPGNTVHVFHETDGAKWEGVSVASDPELLGHLHYAFTKLYSHLQVVISFTKVQTAPIYNTSFINA